MKKILFVLLLASCQKSSPGTIVNMRVKEGQDKMPHASAMFCYKDDSVRVHDTTITTNAPEYFVEGVVRFWSTKPTNLDSVVRVAADELFVYYKPIEDRKYFKILKVY